MEEILIYPTEDITIDQSFGLDNSKHPIRKDFYIIFDDKHSGVDFPVEVGTKVYCSYSGIVVRREFHKGMGNVISVRNGNIIFLYAHLDRFKVKLGQIIKQGNIIGLSGKSGGACPTAHLHFELRDITKPELKEMVFEPKFNQKIENLKDTFTYIVNNTNTKKSLVSLSKLYFGTEKFWGLIRNVNSDLANYKKNKILSERSKVIIPNYKVLRVNNRNC
ncbi:MAG: Peptidase [uncultured bacterium]|nr:MAG: Peptidase [uncultured bacterium]